MKFSWLLISSVNEPDNQRENVLNTIIITIANYTSNYVTNEKGLIIRTVDK